LSVPYLFYIFSGLLRYARKNRTNRSQKPGKPLAKIGPMTPQSLHLTTMCFPSAGGVRAMQQRRACQAAVIFFLANHLLFTGKNARIGS